MKLPIRSLCRFVTLNPAEDQSIPRACHTLRSAAPRPPATF